MTAILIEEGPIEGRRTKNANLTTWEIELREASLHRPEDLVCWRRYSRRHRIHYRPHQLKCRTALSIDGT